MPCKSRLGEVCAEPMHHLHPHHHGHLMPELNEQTLGCLGKRLTDIRRVGHWSSLQPDDWELTIQGMCCHQNLHRTQIFLL